MPAAGGSRTRGRAVLFMLLLAIVAYVPLWSRCSMSAHPQVQYLSSPPVVVNKPCPQVERAPPRHGSSEDAVKETTALPKETQAPPTTASPVATKAEPLAPLHVHIVVFTYRRLSGLQRLLTSLQDAYYGRDDVTLTIFLDYPKKGKSLKDDGTRKFVSQFHWTHGRLNVHRRLANAGLKRTIMEAWFPPGDDSEVAAFFEDDIEVSPLWYVWATAAMRKYGAPGNRYQQRFLGVSLFRPIHDELSGRGCVVKNEFDAFALQQPCSWGAIYYPQPWRVFRDWYDEFNAGGADEDPTVVTLDGQRPSSNTWDRHSSWKKYLIKLMYDKGWFMIYPNPPEKTVLATNHLMKGEHPTPPKAKFELPLLMPDSSEFVDFLGGDHEAAESFTTAAHNSPESRKVFDSKLPPVSEMFAFDVMFKRVDGVENLLPKPQGRD